MARRTRVSFRTKHGRVSFIVRKKKRKRRR